MKEGDYLVGIGDADVKWSSHAEVMTRLEPADGRLQPACVVCTYVALLEL